MPSGVGQAVDEFVARIPDHSCALAFAGPAGIGKTHQLAGVVDLATRRGWRVLMTKPGEAGLRVGGTGLIDLLDGVTDDELASLAPVQHRALSFALMRVAVDDDGPAPEAQLVAAALSGLVAEFARSAPTLVAVDDLQWLDPATATALGFLARHLPVRNVGLVASMRTPAAESSVLAALDSVWALRRMEVPPLDEDEVAALIRSRVDFPVPPSVLSRAAAASGGNPLYGVELAQIWTNESGEFLDSLSVPESLPSLVGSRVNSLPTRCRLALAMASAIGRATTVELGALGLDEDLVPAEQAGVISIQGGTVYFAHPLLAAAAYNGLSSGDRAQLHLRIAGVVADVEHQARHRALASTGTDEGVAKLLDDVSHRAEYRADVNAAVDAARLAMRMTSANRPNAQRRFNLGRLLHKLGDVRAAQIELDAVTGSESPRRIRMRAHILLCELAFVTTSHTAAAEHGRAALDAARPGEDDDLIADAHLYLAQAVDDTDEVRVHAERALDLVAAGARPNPAAHAYAIALIASLDFFAGSPFDAAPFERALEIERAGGVTAEESMIGYYAAVLGYADEVAAGLDLVDRWEQHNVEEGWEAGQPFILMWRSYLLLRAGRLDDAEAAITQHIALSERTGQSYSAHFGRVNRGRLAFYRGTVALAREVAESVMSTAIDLGAVHLEMKAAQISGEAALHDGEPSHAVARLRRVEELRDKGRNEVYSTGHLATLAEAFASLGETDEADAVLANFDDLTRTFGATLGQAISARTRGVIAAARGDDTGALAAFDAALDLFGDEPALPFERARTLLIEGQLLRRLRRKAMARDALTDARVAFAAMRADGWAQRAEDELARIGLRPPAPAELTPTELKIIDMITAGRTAKDIATALYVSPRTVEGHLARIYRKLGVRTRVELITRHSAGTAAGPLA